MINQSQTQIFTQEKNTEIEKKIKEIFADIKFPREPQSLYEPLDYMIKIGGKRLRPHLSLITYSLYQSSFCKAMEECAKAIEIFHGFTLIHDDIMDRSLLRRGQDTVWKKWNEDTAILSGDVMCIDSYRKLACVPSDILPEVLDLFSKTAMQVCEGQQYDMDFEKKTYVDMADYMKMISLKTAVLLACSAKMGAMIGGACQEDCEHLYNYGYYLGLAFQIMDDYLDSFGDEKIFGKAIGGDIINKKKSWLVIKANEKLSEDRRVIFNDLIRSEANTEEEKKAKINTIIQIYRDLGLDKEAKEEIVVLHNEARKSVQKLFLSEAKSELLYSFAQKILEREK